MNAVFTIAAKNYLAQARTLGDSIRALHPDLPFYILLADESEGRLDLSREKYPVIEAKDIGIPHFLDMAYKYNVIEFSTAIKPFFFDYLFRNRLCEKAIYLDPDIYVYQSLEPAFAALDDHILVVTPHIIDICRSSQGSTSLSELLFVGVYNLGFLALRGDLQGQGFLSWWKANTAERGYVDKIDAYHVDQKWFDFIHCFYGDQVLVSRHPGWNASRWNMHERTFNRVEGEYRMNGEPLVFFHFSGFDPHHPDTTVTARMMEYNNLDEQPEYRELFGSYARRLLDNGYDELTPLPRSYTHYDNQEAVFHFQRRLYRKATERTGPVADPFSTAPGSFYQILKKNRLVIHEKNLPGDYRKEEFGGVDRKVGFFKQVLRVAKDLLGFKAYHILMRALFKFARPEEQYFLIEKDVAAWQRSLNG